MTVLDIVILGVIAACAIYGARSGLIREFSHIAAFALGLFLAVKLHSTAASLLLYNLPSNTASVAAFLALLLLVLAAVYLAFSYVKSAADKLKLATADHVAGAAFGAVQGALISALIIFVLVNFSSSLPESYLERSRVASFLLNRSSAVSGIVPKSYISKVISLFGRQASRAQGALEREVQDARRDGVSPDDSGRTEPPRPTLSPRQPLSIPGRD